jgi:hypothetical protein
MTAAIIASTTHAARVCEPKNRPAAFLVRVVAHPDHGERDDAGEDADGEQVLDEPGERPVPDPRDRERPGEQGAVGLDDRQQQDDEAPERRGVRRAGHRPFQQLPLADHLGQLGLGLPGRVRPGVRHPLRRRLPGKCQPPEPPHPPPRHRERDNGQTQPDDHPRKHENPSVIVITY